jgi:hypothetical protein
LERFSDQLGKLLCLGHEGLHPVLSELRSEYGSAYMGEYNNLFLAVGIAVSVFLVVQHVGHAFIRYLNRH